MGTTDIFLLVFIVSVLVVGFFWGALRSLMLVAGWLFAFMAGAYVRPELGAYLGGQWAAYSPSFSVMAAFGIIYIGILVGAPVMIVAFTRSEHGLTNYQVVDDLVGASFAVLVAVLSITGVMIILATYYGADPAAISSAGGPGWTAALYENLVHSTIGEAISESLIPLIGVILGPILPQNVREVFA